MPDDKKFAEETKAARERTLMIINIEFEEAELTLLMQLVNQHIVQLQRTQMQQGRKLQPQEVATPFEAQLLQKMISAREDAIAVGGKRDSQM